MGDTVYCYPNSNVLKNKKNIKDANELWQAEIEYTSARLLELQSQPIKGMFDFKHLCHIHKRIFQDLYTWAGKPRTVDIAKGSLFCLSQFIPSYADTIFPGYYHDCQKTKHDKSKFVHVLVQYYADLNALHPFREGNGRTQREFTRELCRKCGYALDLTRTDHIEMLAASIASFDRGDNTGLEMVFRKCLQSIPF